MDADVLAERILLDLQNAFKKDPFIDEFDILPVNDSVCNKCPVIHIEHKIALESWCVKHVYLYAYSSFMKWKQRRYKINSKDLLSWTSALLLINPDFETAWNTRKDLVINASQTAKGELKFSEVVLSRKPKSSYIFAHRKWLLLEYIKSSPSNCSLHQIIEHELFLCMQAADRYSNNYYAWNHRIWIIQELLYFCLRAISEELQMTEQWVSSHISDHSGFHYRQFLLSSMFTTQKRFGQNNLAICPLHNDTSVSDKSSKCYSTGVLEEKCNICNNHLCVSLSKELKLLTDLQMAFPGHETLWNHRRFIIFKIAQIPPLPNNGDYAESDEDVTYKRYKLETDSSLHNSWNKKNEEYFLHHCYITFKDNAWEKELIIRHIKWLQNSICCKINNFLYSLNA